VSGDAQKHKTTAAVKKTSFPAAADPHRLEKNALNAHFCFSGAKARAI
jgi:hypothetical protein